MGLFLDDITICFQRMYVFHFWASLFLYLVSFSYIVDDGELVCVLGLRMPSLWHLLVLCG